MAAAAAVVVVVVVIVGDIDNIDVRSMGGGDDDDDDDDDDDVVVWFCLLVPLVDEVEETDEVSGNMEGRAIGESGEGGKRMVHI